MERLLMSELQRGPGESLMRLKATAERVAGISATRSAVEMDDSQASA